MKFVNLLIAVLASLSTIGVLAQQPEELDQDAPQSWEESIDEILLRLESIDNRLLNIEYMQRQSLGLSDAKSGDDASDENILSAPEAGTVSDLVEVDWQDDSEFLLQSQDCDNSLLDKSYFLICYNPEWKIARWVGYYLDAELLVGSTDRTDDFREDDMLSEPERSKLSDYRSSGYDRGHMAPAAAFKRSREAMSTTFLMSNMSPQTPSLNRRTWRLLEEGVRSKANTGNGTWVFTGNIVTESSRRIGTGVSVPTHCFKVILHVDNSGVVSGYGFVLPNTSTGISDYKAYQLTIDEVESRTGIDFLSSLPDELENRIESQLSPW